MKLDSQFLPVKPRIAWRHQYDPDRDKLEGDRVAIDMRDPVTGVLQESLTQQSFTEGTDLNVIVKRMGIKDHEMPVAPPVDPRFYGDVSNMPDLRCALDRVRDARERFDALPAALRERFHNRADLLYEFVRKPENWEEAVKIGLLAKREEPAPKAAAPAPQVDPKATS